MAWEAMKSIRTQKMNDYRNLDPKTKMVFERFLALLAGVLVSFGTVFIFFMLEETWAGAKKIPEKILALPLLISIASFVYSRYHYSMKSSLFHLIITFSLVTILFGVWQIFWALIGLILTISPINQTLYNILLILWLIGFPIILVVIAYIIDMKIGERILNKNYQDEREPSKQVKEQEKSIMTRRFIIIFVIMVLAHFGFFELFEMFQKMFFGEPWPLKHVTRGHIVYVLLVISPLVFPLLFSLTNFLYSRFYYRFKESFIHFTIALFIFEITNSLWGMSISLAKNWFVISEPIRYVLPYIKYFSQAIFVAYILDVKLHGLRLKSKS